MNSDVHLLYSSKDCSCFKFFSSLCVLIELKHNALFLAESVHTWVHCSQISSGWTAYRQLPWGYVYISILVQVRTVLLKQISHLLPLPLFLHFDSHCRAIREHTAWVVFHWRRRRSVPEAHLINCRLRGILSVGALRGALSVGLESGWSKSTETHIMWMPGSQHSFSLHHHVTC